MGDENGADRHGVSGDHHVEFADWLTRTDQLMTDFGVKRGGVPGEHLDDGQELANA